MVISSIPGIDLTPIFPSPGPTAVKGTNPVEGVGKFATELISKVNEMQQHTDNEIKKFATGESQGLHEVMIAAEKSGIAMQFLMQVRNKSIEAYQEIMRMQV